MKEAEVFDRKARDILLREIADIESMLISLHKTGWEKTSAVKLWGEMFSEPSNH